MTVVSTKTIIGRVERVDFTDGNVKGLPVKIDTGAYRSSIWATNIVEKDGVLSFRLLGPRSPWYTGEQISTSKYCLVDVESSMGHKQKRYSVFLHVVVAGCKIRSNFTLANRSQKTYPALAGRKMLKNRFIVDVSAGLPLNDEEVKGDDSLE